METQELEIKQLRTLAAESEKNKKIAEAAILFVSYHKTYKKFVTDGVVNQTLKMALQTQVNTYLETLIKEVEAFCGTRN